MHECGLLSKLTLNGRKYRNVLSESECFMCAQHIWKKIKIWEKKKIKKGYIYILGSVTRKVLSVGKLRACCDSLELRAVSHSTVLLLWDPKRLVRNRHGFEGSKRHLPTLWLDGIDACMTCLQRKIPASQLNYSLKETA
jgi:hypothetical protein